MDDVGTNSQRVSCVKKVKSILQSIFAVVVCCQVSSKFDNKKGGAGQCEESPGKGDEKEIGLEKEDQKVVLDHFCELNQNKGADAPDQIKDGAFTILNQYQYLDHLDPNLQDQLSKPHAFPLQENENYHHVHLSSPQLFQCPEVAASADECNHVHLIQSKVLPPPPPVEVHLVQEDRDSTFPSNLVAAPVPHCQKHHSRVNGRSCRSGTLHGKSTQCSHKKDLHCLAEIEKHIDRVASEYRHFQILAHHAQKNQNPHNMQPDPIVHYKCNYRATVPEPCSKTDVSKSEIEKQLDRLANEFRVYNQCLIRHTPSSSQDDKTPRGWYIATLCLRYGEHDGCEAKASKQESILGKNSQDNDQCIFEERIIKCGPCLHLGTLSKLDHQGIMNHRSTLSKRQCEETQPEQQIRVVLMSNSIPGGASKEEGIKNDTSINNERRNLFENHLDKLASEYKYYHQLICQRFRHQDNAANSSQESKNQCNDEPGEPAVVEVPKQACKPDVKVYTDSVPEINRYLDDLAREYQHCKVLVNHYKGFESTFPVSNKLTVANFINQGANDENPKRVGVDPSKRFYPQPPDTRQKVSDKNTNCTPGCDEPVNAKTPEDNCEDTSEKKMNESNEAKGKCEGNSPVKPVNVDVCLGSIHSYKEINDQNPDVKVKCGNVESNRHVDPSSIRKHCRKHHFEDPANFECKSTVRICSIF